jgi:tripartite ATP-independent transporter DctP family solute receptor
MKKLLICLGIALVVALCLSSKQAQAVLNLKAGHTLAPDHPYHLGLEYLAKLVAERTNGEILITVHHSFQLGNERELIESLQLGTQADITIVTTAPLAGFTKEFLVYDLPFIFPDTATARKVLDGPIGQKSLDSVENIDLVGITFFENGFRHITNSKLPLVKPSDAKGLAIRTMENEIHMASFKVLGATPVPMAFGELFAALSQKSIDGQENPLSIIYTSKFYEIQKYCSLTGHFYAPTPLFVGKSVWQKFTQEQKTIFKQAAQEARDYQRGLLDKMNEEYVNQLKSVGMEIIEVETDLWLAAMEPVYQHFEDKIGRDVIAAVREEIA